MALILKAIYKYLQYCTALFSIDVLGFIIAANEALTNAMEHGNNWNKEKKVCIVLTYNLFHVSLYIEDEGDGFNTDQIYHINPVHNRYITRNGIKIIRKLSRAFWNNKGNAVTLLKDIENTEDFTEVNTTPNF